MAVGLYEETGGIDLADDVDVSGGFDPSSWVDAGSGETVVAGSPQAALADGDTAITLTT